MSNIMLIFERFRKSFLCAMILGKYRLKSVFVVKCLHVRCLTKSQKTVAGTLAGLMYLLICEHRKKSKFYLI